MNSLNKLELNNLIVSMRHNVSQAKVHTVNKLTRDVKKLRTKKADEQLKLKNEKKADILLNVVLVMKKIPLDEVAAFSLSNTRNVENILKDTEASLRLKALARLSSHKSISPIVQHFRIKYPSWEKEFPKVLIALKKHEKLKPKNKNKASLKRKTVLTNDSTETDIHDVGLTIDSFCSDDDISKLDNQQVHNRNNNILQKEYSVVFTRGNRFSVSSDDFNVSVNSQNDNISKDISDRNIIRVRRQSNSLNFHEEPIENKNIKEVSLNKKVGYKSEEISLPEKVFDEYESDDLNVENKLSSPQNTKSSSIVERESMPGNSKVINNPKVKRNFVEISKVIKENLKSPTLRIEKKIDSFFLVGDDNQPYEALDTINDWKRADLTPDENDSNFDSDNDFENKSKMKPFSKKSSNVNRKFGQDSVKTKRDFHKPKERHIKHVTTKETRLKSNMPSGKLDVKLLHPSWQAKKKISTLADFQGKKIVFD